MVALTGQPQRALGSTPSPAAPRPQNLHQHSHAPATLLSRQGKPKTDVARDQNDHSRLGLGQGRAVGKFNSPQCQSGRSGFRREPVLKGGLCWGDADIYGARRFASACLYLRGRFLKKTA